VPAATPIADLDRVIDACRARYPHKVMMYMSQEADQPALWFLTMGDRIDDPRFVSIAVDARTARYVAEPPIEGGGLLQCLFHLHVDLFAGVPGKLFLGAMGALFLVAIVSGVVLYAPFMRKLAFGTVRHGRTARLAWLDLHNLLGIVTLAWAFAVGATGIVNTLADVLLGVWQTTEIAAMVKPYAGRPPPAGHAAGHAGGVHRLSGNAVRQSAPLRRLPAWRHGAHGAPVPAGAGRCANRARERRARAAVVPDCAAAVAAAAFRRLCRRRPEAAVGAARHRNHRGAGQRLGPVAAARQGRPRTRRVSRPVRVWRMPLVLGACTALGLAAGLLGDGAWDAAAVAGLATPVCVGVWHLLGYFRRRG
jgi:uncharacterized iron-regulated membrane protein